MSTREMVVGIIGGSGLYELPGLEAVRWKKVKTPFGDPSDAYSVGRLGDRTVVFLPRHGRGHRLAPSELNFRANIYGFKSLGVEWLVSVSAVGSMKESIRPLDLLIPDQFFDWTRRRVSSFFGDGIVAHVGLAEPVCADLADALYKAASASGAMVHRGGTYICIEGPQFSSKAESEVYRHWGMDVIGMTNMPEAKLAREAELCYATLALVTDYDVWHETEEAVTVEAVIANLIKNVETAKDVLRRVVPAINPARACHCPRLLKDAVITNPSHFPASARRKLGILLDKYYPLSQPSQRSTSQSSSSSSSVSSPLRGEGGVRGQVRPRGKTKTKGSSRG